MINVKQLLQELEAAGIAVNGCNSNGIVWDTANKEIQKRADVAAVIKAHIPADPAAEKTLEEKYADLEAKVTALETQVSSVTSEIALK